MHDRISSQESELVESFASNFTADYPQSESTERIKRRPSNVGNPLFGGVASYK
jgi:hypothetical protein